MRLLIILIVFSTFVISAKAQDCSNLINQSDMNDCEKKKFEKADKQLSIAYKKLQKRLKVTLESEDLLDVQKLLTTAQQAWTVYRDAECKFSSSSNTGGTVHPMIELQCLASMTEIRIKDFNAYLKCQSGDLACPF